MSLEADSSGKHSNKLRSKVENNTQRKSGETNREKQAQHAIKVNTDVRAAGVESHIEDEVQQGKGSNKGDSATKNEHPKTDVKGAQSNSPRPGKQRRWSLEHNLPTRRMLSVPDHFKLETEPDKHGLSDLRHISHHTEHFYHQLSHSHDNEDSSGKQYGDMHAHFRSHHSDAHAHNKGHFLGRDINVEEWGMLGRSPRARRKSVEIMQQRRNSATLYRIDEYGSTENEAPKSEVLFTEIEYKCTSN